MILDSPYACYTDHGLVEILVASDTVGCIQHSLTCPLRLRLGDSPAVAIQNYFV